MEERLELLATVRHGVATATLNRPEALNALTATMLDALAAALEAWARDDAVKVVVLRGAGGKAFCAGGDVRALHEGHRAGRKDLLDFFIVEYALDYRLHTFPKPVVAVLDGIVMGGGMGLSQGATLRIATDKTKMAMPETTIGLFPDVGGSWFLPRAPGHVGMYLGLIGPTLRAADAIYANLADAYFAPPALEHLDAELEAAAGAPDPRAAVKALGTRFGSKPPAGELESRRAAIEEHFSRGGVNAIAASLAADDDEWARKTGELLARRSPTALAVTHEQLVRGKSLSLGEVFRMELGMVAAALEHGDFMEGVRALLVDKDNAPRWNPPTLAGLQPATVAKFFAPRWTDSSHPLKDLP